MSRIVAAELFLATLPLVRDFQTSSHRKSELDHIILKLTSADGVVGWGECASPTDPYYGPESVEICWLVLRDYLLPAVLGRHWQQPEEIHQLMSRIKGNRFAKAAVDIACHDLSARERGISVAAVIGATQSSIESGVSLGIEQSLDDLLRTVTKFVDEGYRRVKLKIGPGWDVRPVAAIRKRFGELPLQVDANGAYPDTPASMKVLKQLDDFGLLMIEQPFADDDLLAHSRAQEQLCTSVCLDESVTSLATAKIALALEAARIINIKVSRLGGIGPAKAVHDLCYERAVPVWCGGMHEFGVGRAANVAVAALPGFVLPSDISGSDKYFSSDIVDPPIHASQGTVVVPFDRPGLGHEVDTSRLSGAIRRQVRLIPRTIGTSR